MFFYPNHKKLILLGLVLALIGAACVSLSTRKESVITPVAAMSIAVPRVKLNHSSFQKETIVADIEVWNLIDTYVNSILLKLKCSTSNQENVAFFIQLLSKDNPIWHSTYKISYRHFMSRGFAFKEKREIRLEFDIDAGLSLVECTKLHVLGYRQE